MVLQNVMNQLTQQLNVVQEQAHSPMQAMIQQVQSGVWIGRGADAFVEEVSNLFIPSVGFVSSFIGKTQQNINQAVDIMDQADNDVRGMVENLADMFDGIF
jgi:hypothetical protein